MEHNAARRVLVPINGGTTDGEAVAMGCRVARRQNGRVFIITVLEIRRGLALGAVQQVEIERCERWLDTAEEIGKRLGVEVTTELLQAREAGSAIVDEIRELRADVVVLGMPWRLRFGDFHMGRTAPHVLRHAPCRVVLIREEPAEGA